MTPPPGDGIFVPVNLDTTPAMEAFESLKNTVTATDLRPNQALDDFFSGVEANAVKATVAVQKMKLDMLALSRAAKTMSPGMNMRALAGSAYKVVPPMQRGRAFSNDYQRLMGNEDAAKKSAYENRFQNRYLESEIQDGTYRKKASDMIVAERAATRLQKRQDELLKQGRLIVREQRYGRFGGRLAHFYKENESAISGAMGAAGRTGSFLGRGAAAAGVGLTVSGYSGTIEGERFAREMRVLSLELAATFKPMADAATEFTRRTRRNLQEMNRGQQDRLMVGAGVAAGAALGAKAGSMAGPKGALAGALVGGLLGGAAARSQTEAAQEQMRFDSVRGGGYSDAFAYKNADLAKMSPAERLAEVERRREAIVQRGIRNREQLRQFEGTADEDRAKKAYFQAAVNLKDEVNALEEIKKRTKAGQSIDGMMDVANPNRRQLMITEGTGFAGAGSTFFALQEDLARTTAVSLEIANQQRQELIDIMKEQSR